MDRCLDDNHTSNDNNPLLFSFSMMIISNHNKTHVGKIEKDARQYVDSFEWIQNHSLESKYRNDKHNKTNNNHNSHNNFNLRFC